ncbi:uncharacterized protein JCM15063_004425 [Sporobolomyces koalae]|uniref:uncharacterized protein n=1 Tax=Sporobolomyces koalae TaxID=500713 RepID=UPI00316CBB7F
MTAEKPAPRPIAKLAEAVVNRIAAGEIIQRPSNALKELIENSLDAGATYIRISVKEGGVKLLQIQDNGSGIRKEDLAILCERFTTSKIKVFDDLSSLGTYGFRGEALASISHVAHLTITTKTKTDACAWKAAYSDGQLVPVKSGSTNVDPVPTAGNDGTTIVVEDLFFNTPQRLKSLRSASDEYGRIVSVALAYSIHNAGIAISCKRQNAGSTADVNTQVGASVLDNIGLSYGEHVKKELVSVKADDERFGVKVNALCTGLNYQAKKGIYYFFINNRYVDCSPLKRALEGFYGTLLAKGSHPFVYLSLSIAPNKIDVNVHPTKKEVGFEDQDEIVELICEALAKALESQGESRSYKVQTLLPGARTPKPSTPTSIEAAGSSASADPPVASTSTLRKPTKTAPQKLVRTDANSQTLDSMFPVLSSSSSRRSDKGKERASEPEDEDVLVEDDRSGQVRPTKKFKSDHDPGLDKVVAEEKARQMLLARVRISQSDCALTSVKTLRNQVIERRNEELEQIFKNHIFVGVADTETGRSLIQYQTKLYLVHHNIVAEQLFYQLTLRQFGRFSRIKLQPAPSLKKLIRLGVERGYSHGGSANLSIDDIINRILERILDAKDMIQEYFSISIDEDGALESLPLILPAHAPDLQKLPLFLLRIGIYVDWEREQECFESLSRELAYFYSPARLDLDSNSSTFPQAFNEAKAEEQEQDTARKSLIKNVLFPAFKQYLVPPSRFGSDSESNSTSTDGTGSAQNPVVLITRLESLYKVFERC